MEDWMATTLNLGGGWKIWKGGRIRKRDGRLDGYNSKFRRRMEDMEGWKNEEKRWKIGWLQL